MDKLGQPNIKDIPITDEEWRFRIQEGFRNVNSDNEKIAYNAHVDLQFYKSETVRLGKDELFGEEQVTYLWAKRGFFLERSNVEINNQTQI